MRPTAKMRRTHTLPTQLWVDDVSATLGEPLTVTIGSGHWDEDLNRLVKPPQFKWGTVSRVDVLHAPHVDYRPFDTWRNRLPDLGAARDAQVAAASTAAPFGLGEVAFKDRVGMSAWAGDTPITLAVDGDFFTIEAQIPDGDIRGKTTYGWATLDVGPVGKLRAKQGSGLDPATTATVLAAAWTTFDRRSRCSHPHPSDPYCRDCGAGVDDRGNPDG